MVFRFIALLMLALGVALGVSFLIASGAVLAWQIRIGLGVPILASLILAYAWWRRAGQP